MGKLDNKKMERIIQNRKYRGMSILWLSSCYEVSERRIRQILAYDKEYGCPPILQKRGSKVKMLEHLPDKKRWTNRN